MKAKDIIDHLLIEEGQDVQGAIHALEDGAALEAMGWDDQEAVEEAYSALKKMLPEAQETVRQMTEAGWAYILQEDDAPIKLAVLESHSVGTRGSITLGRLEEKGEPGTYCLFWEWGGDWMVFGDDARYNAEEIAGWEPDAIREALEIIKKRGWDLGEDMEWFVSWADAAEATKEEQ